VSRVFVDLESLVPGGPGGSPAVGPVAARALGYLAEAGHDVVLVADLEAIPRVLVGVVTGIARAAPNEPHEPSWYLTTDVERCRGRSARLRTVLVGTAAAPAAIHRCDTLARDVQAAVLELLAAEAMPGA
jgi:hypothetical protein